MTSRLPSAIAMREVKFGVSGLGPRRKSTLVLSAARAGWAGVVLGLSLLLVASTSGASTGWTSERSANLSKSNETILTGVSCVSAAWCRAVGGSEGLTSLVVSGPAKSWSRIRSAALNVRYVLLDAISCTSRSFCMAVGSLGASPLAIRWNGASWRRVAVSAPQGFQNSLDSVSCTSSTWCVAVGTHVGFYENALIETWSGSAWQRDATPPSTTNPTFLSGVTCTSAADCFAVGSTGAAGGVVQDSLVEQWNGSTWSVDPSPSPGASETSLSSVACATASDCVAVGWLVATPTSEPDATVILAWNGSTWVTSSTAAYGTSAEPELLSVACDTGGCTAVGETTGGPTRTLVLQRTAGTWSVVRSPNVKGRSGSLLDGVACASGRCVAVGASQGLAEGGADGAFTTNWPLIESSS